MLSKILQTVFSALTPFCMHYWGVPHRDKEGRLIQCCYGCGGNRRVKVDL